MQTGLCLIVEPVKLINPAVCPREMRRIRGVK